VNDFIWFIGRFLLGFEFHWIESFLPSKSPSSIIFLSISHSFQGFICNRTKTITHFSQLFFGYDFRSQLNRTRVDQRKSAVFGIHSILLHCLFATGHSKPMGLEFIRSGKDVVILKLDDFRYERTQRIDGSVGSCCLYGFEVETKSSDWKKDWTLENGCKIGTLKFINQKS